MAVTPAQVSAAFANVSAAQSVSEANTLLGEELAPLFNQGGGGGAGYSEFEAAPGDPIQISLAFPKVTFETLPSGALAGDYGSGSQSLSVHVDKYGRITSISAVPISFPGPTGPASGDLSGTYPAPAVAGLRGYPLPASMAAPGLLRWSGSAWDFDTASYSVSTHDHDAAYLKLIGGALSGPLFSPGVTPTSSFAYDLGSATARWDRVWAKDLTINGISTSATDVTLGAGFSLQLSQYLGSSAQIKFPTCYSTSVVAGDFSWDGTRFLVGDGTTQRALAFAGESVAWGSITGKPTTLAGYSIGATDVTAQVLTGYAVGVNTPILASDSIRGAFGKLQAQVSTISDGQISSSAAIAWSKISKSGALPGDVGALGATAQAVDSALLGGNPSSYFQAASTALALGTTSTTACRGDLGTIAYSHSQAGGNPHSTTAAQVGALGVTATAVNSSALGGVSADSFVQGDNATRSTSRGGAVALSSINASGFYTFSSPPDSPNASSDWTHLVHCAGYAWGFANRYALQIASSFSGDAATSWGPETYAVRVITDGTPQSWKTLWHSGNFAPSNYLPLTGGTISGNLGVSGTVTAAVLRHPTGLSTQFLKADGSIDTTTYISDVMLFTDFLPNYADLRYQRLENQRLSTTNNVEFNTIRTVGYINAYGAIYANATLRTAGLTVDSYSITANTAAQLNGTGWTVNAPWTFATSPLPYGGAQLGSYAAPWDAWVSRLRAGSASITIESPLAFSGPARVTIGSSGWNAPAPSGGLMIVVEGESAGPNQNQLKVPAGVAWGIWYRDDDGIRTFASAGDFIQMYFRSGIMIAGADGNWHLFHS